MLFGCCSQGDADGSPLALALLELGGGDLVAALSRGFATAGVADRLRAGAFGQHVAAGRGSGERPQPLTSVPSSCGTPKLNVSLERSSMEIHSGWDVANALRIALRSSLCTRCSLYGSTPLVMSF